MTSLPTQPPDSPQPALLAFTPAPPDGHGGELASRTRDLVRGGLGTAVDGLTAALDKLGVEVRFADVKGFDTDLYSSGVPATFDVPSPADGGEVAWAHDWMSGQAAHDWAARNRRPWLLHIHSTARERGGGLDAWIDPHTFAQERRLTQLASRVVCVSERTAGVVRSDYEVDPGRVTVVHNGQSELDSRLVRRPGRDICASFIGRFDWHKAPDKFIEAGRLLWREQPDRRFVMGGDGPLRGVIEARIRALGMERAIFPTTWLAPESRDMVLARSQLLIMPSPAEPFGLVALEAVALGAVPLIASSAGVREVLPSCPAVDASSPSCIAAAAAELLALDEEAHQELISRLREEAWRASWDRSARKLAQLAREVLGQGA